MIWLVLTFRKTSLVKGWEMDRNEKNQFLSEEGRNLLAAGGTFWLPAPKWWPGAPGWGLWRKECQWINNICHLKGVEDGGVQAIYSMTLIKLWLMRDWLLKWPPPSFLSKKEKHINNLHVIYLFIFTIILLFVDSRINHTLIWLPLYIRETMKHCYLIQYKHNIYIFWSSKFLLECVFLRAFWKRNFAWCALWLQVSHDPYSLVLSYKFSSNFSGLEF